MKGITDFKNYLKNKGLRSTKTRLIIFEELKNLKKHFSAEQVYLALNSAQSQHKISRSTIYRTLALFEELGLLESVDFGDGFKTYEYAFQEKHHDHLICLDHNEIVEFYSPEIEKLQEQIADEHGFYVVYHSLKIYVRHKSKDGKREEECKKIKRKKQHKADKWKK